MVHRLLVRCISDASFDVVFSPELNIFRRYELPVELADSLKERLAARETFRSTLTSGNACSSVDGADTCC